LYVHKKYRLRAVFFTEAEGDDGVEVFVNNERRELKVTDVLTGKDYATALICSDQVVDTDEYNRFVMTETEYNRWKNLLTVLQESEDLRPNLIQAVGKEKLDNYIFEETKYLTQASLVIKEENISLKLLKKALHEKNSVWLKENGFV
jgi:conserved domain protein